MQLDLVIWLISKQELFLYSGRVLDKPLLYLSQISNASSFYQFLSYCLFIIMIYCILPSQFIIQSILISRKQVVKLSKDESYNFRMQTSLQYLNSYTTCIRKGTITQTYMSKQRPSGQTKDGNSISSKLLGANLSDINIQKFRDLVQYQKQTYQLSGKLSIPILKTVSNKFCPQVIFTINLPNQAIGSIQCLSQCINLMVINLSRNSIDNLSPLKEIKTMRIVNFSQNNIKSVQAFKNSKELTNVHLQGNIINSLQDLGTLNQCKQLRNLHLQMLSGTNENPLCQLKNYRQNVFSMLESLKRLDGVPKNVQFNNGSQIKSGKRKQIKIQLKAIGPFYTNKFPSSAQYQVPTFVGQTGLKKSLASCKTQIQDLQLRVRALLTQ